MHSSGMEQQNPYFVGATEKTLLISFISAAVVFPGFFVVFFFKVFGGHMSIFGAAGTPVLDFW